MIKTFFNLYKKTMQNDIIFWQTIQCCHKIILYGFIIAVDDRIRDEKLLFNTNKEA